VSAEHRGGRSRGFEESLFRALIRAYGPGFRDRWSEELICFFRQEREDPRYRGPLGAIRFWRRTLHDLAAAAVRDRLQTHIPPGRSRPMFYDFLADVRLAVRSFRRQPTLVLVATVTLAVGIAATTVVFPLIDAALLRPLPFEQADRIAFVSGTLRSDREDTRGASYPEIQDWRAGTDEVFDGLAAFSGAALNLTGGDLPERIGAEIVDASYFDVLGATPVVGRVFSPEENRVPERDPVIVIGETLWERRFARDPEVVGRAIRVNARELVVIGVLPAEFRGLSLQAEAWVPAMMAELIGRGSLMDSRGQRWMSAVGRLRSGVDFAEAQDSIDAVAAALGTEYPDSNEDRTGSIRQLRDLYLGTTRDLMVALGAASLLLLAVAALNVAGLLLVRAGDRSGEIAVRQALGSGRGRIRRQLLVDSAVIASLGTLAGVLLAYWLLGVVVGLLPPGTLPAFVAPTVDLRALAFAAGALVLTALVAGTLPAWQSARIDLAATLRGTRSGPGKRAAGTRRLFVIAEVAVAATLLVGTGLMARTFAAKADISPGFDPAFTAFRLQPPPGTVDPEDLPRVIEAVAAELRDDPSIEAVTYGAELPLQFGGGSATFMYLTAETEDGLRQYFHRIPPGFLQTMGIRLIAGRDFAETDGPEDPMVALVSRELADRHFPQGALGEVLYRGDAAPVRIVGIVDSVRWRDLTTNLTEPGSNPDIYFAYAQRPARAVSFAVRPRSEAVPLAEVVRAAVARVDAALPVTQFVSLEQRLDVQTALDRLAALVLAFFACAALVLAAVGVYGSLAHAVQQRSREIAIRIALGASDSQVRRRVVGSALALGGIGLGIGLLGAIGLGRSLQSLLYGVTWSDPLTFVAVWLLLGATVLLAAWVPARRATRVPPHAALQGD
jgi:putative ABC transport system permease protein